MMVSISELKRLRELAGYSQEDIAMKVGKTQAYISRMETGTLDPKYSIVYDIFDLVKGLQDVPCVEVMTQNPVIIEARQSVTAARNLMLKHRITVIPVMRGTQVIGCITDIDIFENAHLDLNHLSVEAIMNKNGIPIVDEQTPLLSISSLFDTYSAIVVQSSGRVTGIIPKGDNSRLKKLSNLGIER